MKYAKAMYLGGQYISAEESDYTSAKTYGLVCPCCQSAVFLRGHGMRLNTLRNGQKKLQLINPYFAHYPTGIDDFDCELRSPYKFSEAVIKLAQIEAREQRLKLYNKHLIKMYDQDRNSTSLTHIVRTKACKSVFTKTWKEKLVQNMRRLVSKDPEMLLYDKEALIDFVTTPLQNKIKLFEESQLTEFTTQIVEEDGLLVDYFSRHDLNLHMAIANEIIEFTFTATGGYFLLHLVDLLLAISVNCLGMLGMRQESQLWNIRNLLKADFCINFACHTIQQTRWLDVIPTFLQNELQNKLTFEREREEQPELDM